MRHQVTTLLAIRPTQRHAILLCVPQSLLNRQRCRRIQEGQIQMQVLAAYAMTTVDPTDVANQVLHSMQATAHCAHELS